MTSQRTLALSLKWSGISVVVLSVKEPLSAARKNSECAARMMRCTLNRLPRCSHSISVMSLNSSLSK